MAAEQIVEIVLPAGARCPVHRRVHAWVSQSPFAPDVLTITDHLVSSRSMSAAYSSGVDASGSAPSSARRDLNSSDGTAGRSAAPSLSMIGRGVPAGATMP